MAPLGSVLFLSAFTFPIEYLNNSNLETYDYVFSSSKKRRRSQKDQQNQLAGSLKMEFLLKQF